MSRFADKAKDRNEITNYEGAPAYQLNDEMALYSLVCTSMVQDQYYRSAEGGIQECFDLCSRCTPEFISRLARYARSEMNLRSIPQVLAVWLCLNAGGRLAADTVFGVVRRADEIVEILSFFATVNPNATKKKPLAKVPKGLANGIKRVFECGRFDEYQFAKYNRKTGVRLRDALFLTHPKPNGDAELFKRLASDTLQTPYTWEVELSKGGDKKETWERLILSDKVGYMALLRNLRNIIDAKVGMDAFGIVTERLQSDEVLRAKQFPFRFWSAYKELNEADIDPFYKQEVFAALEIAIVKSLKNIPSFKGRTLIACDTSGSMDNLLSGNSSLTMMEVGLVLGALVKHCNPKSVVGQFATNWMVFEGSSNPFAMINAYLEKSGEVGWSTNGHMPIDWIAEKNIQVDDVMFFTDMQMWDSRGGGTLNQAWQRYKQLFPESRLWIFDLHGYGQSPLRISGDVSMIAGWSDRVFEAVESIRGGEKNLEFIKAF